VAVVFRVQGRWKPAPNFFMTFQLSANIDRAVRRLRFMPWRHGLQLALQGTVILGLAALCLLVLAWLTLQWGILPHIEDWRPAIERHASKAVGVPVRIGHISVRASGWVPALEMRDVVLLDPAGPEALRLPRVAAALSPRSLLVFAPRLSQLYIEDAHLVVRRDARGHLHVAGIDVPERAASPTAVEDSGAIDWFFGQQEFVLRHGSVRWIDEQRGAQPLELGDVDLVVRNGLRSHALRLDATPPAAWGERFSLRLAARQPLLARPGDWRRWSGTAYADLPRGDVAQLQAYVDLPFELSRGEGGLRLWLDFQTNGWRGLTADVRLRDVDVRLAHDVAPLAIAQASGRLVATRTSAGVSFGAEHFGFATADGVVWPRGDIHVGWDQRQTLLKPAQAMPAQRERASGPAAPSSGAPTVLWDTDHPITGGRVAADALDLTLMRRLADALPLPAAAQRWLADWQPAGVVKGLAARWDGPFDAPAHYRATATIDGFSVAAGPVPVGTDVGRPGWHNAHVAFDANETGGSARLGLDGGSIELPGVFDAPVIPFERFGANARWSITKPPESGRPAQVALALQDVHFENDDAAGDLTLGWRTGADAGAKTAARAPSGASTSIAANSARAMTAASVASAATAANAASTASPGDADFGPGRRLPGVLDLQGVLHRARASQLARFLPRTVGEQTRGYLRAAFPDGDLDHVEFKVRGDLAEFPYHRHNDGEFHIAGHLSNATMNYVPGPLQPDGTNPPLWPVFTQLKADIVLDRGTLEIHDGEARMGELALRGVRGGIRTLYDGQTLALDGRVAGPMPEFLRYVAQSPIGGWLHNGLAATTASGNAELQIALAIPLAHASDATVAGALLLPGNDVRFMPEVPTLVNTRARVDFTQGGVTVSGASARALGGELVFDGGSQADGSLRFVAQGTATADGLRRNLDDPVVARLASRLSGQTTYRLQLAIAHGQTEFALSSPLTGVGLALPAPLDKPADANWPLRVSTAVAFDAQGRPHDTLRVDLSNGSGAALQAEVLRDLGGAQPKPLRVAYAVGAPLPTAQAGGVAVVRAGTLSADAWWALWRSLEVGGPANAGAGAAGPPTGVPDASYWPATVSLRAQDLLLGGHHLTGVDLQLAQTVADTTEGWRATVSSDQTHGVIEYRPESAARGAQLFARLDRLALEAHDGEESGGTAGGARPQVEASGGGLPALDIVVDNFELDGKPLGKLEVAATSQAAGRDWRLTRLGLTLPEARFTGVGQWIGAPARRMTLDFKLELADSGALLERLGLGRVLKGGKGALSGQVTWAGSPLELDYPSLGGRLEVALDQGQFLKASAGAGRLLSVLSLQSLPRRLTLDFRDVFQEGFAFDNVTGDVRIDHGVATTNNLRMRGVSAVVLMEGSADLRAETQDLRVVVVPEINAGAVSLAYATINPVIGLGTFLAQLFLRNPLAKAGTKEFHVAGSWSDPKVEPVEHREALAEAGALQARTQAASAPASGAAAPAAAPASAAASAALPTAAATTAASPH
jgi:uncharacterized protein (TIGR02099 family)